MTAPAARPRRRAAVAVLVAWCVALAAVAADEPLPAAATDADAAHSGLPADVVSGVECDTGTPPSSHSNGVACYYATHGVHRRLDHYREQRDTGSGWSDTGKTRVRSCERRVQDASAADHGMSASAECATEPHQQQPAMRWRFDRTEFSGSGHAVTWYPAVSSDGNTAPAFGPAPAAQTIQCCGTWVKVATLRAADADVVQTNGVWQDDLRFASRSGNSRLGVSRLTNATRFSGGLTVDLEVLPAAPGTTTVTVDVRDLKAGATDSVTLTVTIEPGTPTTTTTTTPEEEEEEEPEETTTTTTPASVTTTTTVPTATTTTAPSPVSCADQGLYENLDGTCVAEPCSPGTVPDIGPDGRLWGCKDIGACPYDELNNARYRTPPKRNEPRYYSPQWRTAPKSIPAVAAGTSTLVRRTVIKCADLWREHVNWPMSTSHCFWDERTLHPRGDCLALYLTVVAHYPAQHVNLQWWQRASGCGHNRSAANPSEWTSADTVCSSTGARWRKSRYWFTGGVSQNDAPAGVGPAAWTVTLLDGALRGYGGSGWPLVDVPVRIDVSDWGDASRLDVWITATAPGKTLSGCPQLSCGVLRYHGSSAKKSSVAFSVPRRSGPAPAGDVIEVKIADLDDKPADERFVDIDRATLLANDGCTADTHCDDPDRWPVHVAGKGAEQCSTNGRARTTMLSTDQGTVGCDTLDTVGGSVRYWPKMWAAGSDHFAYRTYGGDATVTIRFTDSPPGAPPTVVADDAGAVLATAQYRRTDSRWDSYSKQWLYNYTPVEGGLSPVWHHSAVVALPVVGDADGDYAGRRLAPAAATTEVRGRYSIRADMLSSRARRGHEDFYTEIHQAGDGTGLGARTCVQWAENIYGSYYCRLNVALSPGGHACLQIDSQGVCARSGTLQQTVERRVGYLQYDRRGCRTTRRYWTANSRLGQRHTIFVPAGERCADSDYVYGRLACPDGFKTDELCYTMERTTAAYTLRNLNYWACDDRYLSYLADRSRATAAGRSPSDYCSEGVVQLRLGVPPPTVRLDSAAQSVTEGNPFRFGVTLSKPAGAGGVRMSYRVVGVTATAGSDYTPPTQYFGVSFLLIPEGASTASIKIPTVVDAATEGDETLTVTLNHGAGRELGEPYTATGTITDFAAAAFTTAAGASVVEGGTLRFGVRLAERAGPSGARIGYRVVDGTAIAGFDYTAPASSGGVSVLAVPAGATSAVIEIATLDDELIEGTENLTVSLHGAAQPASGTIIDNDVGEMPVPTMVCAQDGAYTRSPVLSLGWASPEVGVRSYAAEIFTGTFNGPAPAWAFVEPTTRRVANAQAIASWRTGYNYPRVLRGQRYTGDWSGGGVRYPVWGETYTLRMRFSPDPDPPDGTPAIKWAHATATCPPQVTLSPAERTVGEDGGSVEFVLSMPRPWAAPVAVTVASADGSAEAGKDYVRLARRVTIPAGETAETVTVLIIDDEDHEPEPESGETFTVAVSAPSVGHLGRSTATVTITDNDEAAEIIYR